MTDSRQLPGPRRDGTASWGHDPAGQPTYYEPGEVEDYIQSVTATIEKLQVDVRAQARRADQAEQWVRRAQAQAHAGDRTGLLTVPEETSNRSLADSRIEAAEIVRQAERNASRIVESAHERADLLVDAAQRTAFERSHERELRLLAAVNSVVQRSQQLREDLRLIETEAGEWRLELARSTSRSPAAPGPLDSPSPASDLNGQPERRIAPSPDLG